MNTKAQTKKERKEAVAKIVAVFESLDDFQRHDVMDDIKDLYCEYCWGKKDGSATKDHGWCSPDAFTPLE